MTDVGWKFPLNNGGGVGGINDMGINYFMADPIISMTRETLQDSLDAVYDKEKPVLVKFERFDLPIGEIPKVNEIKEIFLMCLNTWEHNNEAAKFFQQGYTILNDSQTIPVLAIRDFNTTGLENIHDPIAGSFNSLVKSVGVTNKSSTANGSFGIGKHAPFATSSLRTMFYGTYNRQNDRAIQGVAKLASYNTGNNEFTQSTGYYGTKSNLGPLFDFNNLNMNLKRTDYGTDKFVIGFNGKEDWYVDVVEAVIGSYLVAIMEGQLEVQIMNLTINKMQMKRMVDFTMTRKPKSLIGQFYEAYVSSQSKLIEQEFQTPEGNSEKISLYLLPREGFKNKIAMYRGTGMKIFDKDRFRTPINFAGVLVVQGTRLNEILRKMEPPTHDKWEAGLYKDDEQYGKKLIRNINDWLRDEIKKLIGEKDEEIIELKGLENILPNITEQEAPYKEIDVQTVDERIKDFKMKKVASVSKANSTSIIGKIKNTSPKEKPNEKKELSKIKKEDNRKERKSRKPKAKVERLRIYQTNENENSYRLIIKPSDLGELKLNITIAAEIGKSAEVKIKKAMYKNRSIPFSNNTLGPIEVTDLEKISVDIEFEDINRYSLEVTV